MFKIHSVLVAIALAGSSSVVFAQALPTTAPAPAEVVPTPPSSGKVMTAKALGATYESFIDIGWTDVTLIEHGMMEPPGGNMPF